MKTKTSITALLGTILLTFFTSCSTTTPKEDVSPLRKEVLAAIADNVIIPNYDLLLAKSTLLTSKTDSFAAHPTLNDLKILRNAWLETAIAWKYCEQFGFGPGETTAMLDVQIGTWPANPTLINNEIATRTILGDDFIASTGSTRKGLYAFEYLIFGDSSVILANYTTDEKASIRKAYIQQLSKDIRLNVNSVDQNWKNGYRDNFLQADGLDVGSSFGIIINKMVESLETTINLQIGNPIGKRTLTDNGMLRPTAVEAIYSNSSKALCLANIDALKAVFTADNQGVNGKGIDDYVAYLKITQDGTPLEQKIITQMDAFRAAVDAIPDPMQTSVTANTSAISTAWTQGKKLLVLVKNDLPVNIGVQITFNSNDGD